MSHSILIVDDSKTVRTVLRRAVGLSGVETSALHEAGNGKEALELLEKVSVDLVMTDIHMPTMGGVELVQKLRESDQFASMPVVVISSDRMESRREQLRGLSVDSILEKPFRPECIRDLLRETLGA